MLRLDRTPAQRAALTSAAIIMGLLLSGSTAAAQDDGPLQARLYEPLGSQLQFTVSRPAYVAVFEVLPGTGMTMLHPWTTYGTQRRFAAGNHSFLPQRSSFHRTSYTYGTYNYGSYNRFSSPIVLLLIASERPLRLEGLPRAPMALMNQVGFASYHPAATFDAVERLASRIVPDADYTDWAYDTYIIWPESHTPVLAMHPVLCADGNVRFIVGGRLPPGCLKPSASPTAPDSARPPQDSGKTRVRRAPQGGSDRSGEKSAVERPRSRGTAVGSSRKPAVTEGGGAARRPQPSGGGSPAGSSSSSGGRKPEAAPPRPAAPQPAPAPAAAPGSGGRETRASEVPNN